MFRQEMKAWTAIDARVYNCNVASRSPSCPLYPGAVDVGVLHIASGLRVLKPCAGYADIVRRRPPFCLLFSFSIFS